MQDGNRKAREKELLAAADVAGMIRVKETTVYRWCNEGKLPCLKIGKHWRIRRGVLEDFLKQRSVPGRSSGSWTPSCGCQTACWQ
jgi:excisionase family DNA binding protein